MTSVELFLYEESDFTGYYNNYLKFLNNGFKIENFEYGGGLEIFLPLINYCIVLLLNENLPYMVLFIHSFILLSLFSYLIYLIIKYYRLNLADSALLIAFMFLLFKYGTVLNHLRQAYASLFILIAIFKDNYSKNIYIFFAIFTHLSSIVIYPLVLFLLQTKNVKRIKRFIVLSILSGMLIYSMFNLIYIFSMSLDNVLLTKIRFALIYVTDGQDISKYITTTLVALFYIIVILIIFKILTLKYKTEGEWNLYAILAFVISFSYLPGISFRLIDPILTFLLGYLFFRYLRLEIKFKQAYLVGILIMIFFQYKWMLFNVGYYQKYPMFDIHPLYYIESYFETQESIDRYALPHLKDIELENKFK
jgi:hypothetical protein